MARLEAKNLTDKVNTRDSLLKASSGQKSHLVLNNAMLDALIASTESGTYVIASDITLDSTKMLPSGVTLEFRDSKIELNSFSLIGNNTIIRSNESQIFDRNGNIGGTWLTNGVYPDNFFNKGTETNFSPSFEFAINNFKLVKLLPKSYSIESSIDIISRSNFRIEGSGIGVSELIVENNNSCFEFQSSGNTNKNIEFDNFKITNGLSYLHQFNAFNITETDTIYLKNIDITGAIIAFNIVGGFYFSEFNNIKIYNVLNYGLQTSGSVAANRFHFTSIQLSSSATAVSIGGTSVGNKIEIGNMSNLNKGVVLNGGDYNRIAINYIESIGGSIQDSNFLAITNIKGANFLEEGYIHDGISVIGGSLSVVNRLTNSLAPMIDISCSEKNLNLELDFEDLVNSKVTDWSGLNNDFAVFGNVGFSKGYNGSALYLKSFENTYARFLLNSDFKFDDDFTFGVNSRGNAYSGAEEDGILCYIGGGVDGSYVSIHYNYQAIQLRVYNGTSFDILENVFASNDFRNLNTTHFVFISLSYNKSSQILKVYQGGVLLKTYSGIDISISNTGQEYFYLGFPNSSPNVFIDKVYSYQSELSQQEISGVVREYYLNNNRKEVLYTPDGLNKYRLSVDNQGVLSTVII